MYLFCPKSLKINTCLERKEAKERRSKREEKKQKRREEAREKRKQKREERESQREEEERGSKRGKKQKREETIDDVIVKRFGKPLMHVMKVIDPERKFAIDQTVGIISKREECRKILREMSSIWKKLYSVA